MPNYYITLGNGKQLTLGQYATAWRTCKAAPAGAEFKQGLGGWWPETREKILRDFLYGLHDRINLRGERMKKLGVANPI